ncbi:MAG: DeoR/GlpR family DNA-binding transcription regulator, partial [Phocaeicola sp.]
MTKEERKRFIVTQIRAGEKVYITSLSQELGVSDDTLRRDLIELDSEGVLMRVHGGAVARTAHSHQYTDRIHLNSTQKQRLASKVIPLLRPHDVIILDGGTTNVEVARQLPRNLPLTIYTNSFPIVNELMHFAHIELVFLGGTVFPKSEVTVGIP